MVWFLISSNKRDPGIHDHPKHKLILGQNRSKMVRNGRVVFTWVRLKNRYPKWHKQSTILQSSSVAFPNLVANTSLLQDVGVHKFWPKHDMLKHHLNEFEKWFWRCATCWDLKGRHNLHNKDHHDYINPSYIPLYVYQLLFISLWSHVTQSCWVPSQSCPKQSCLAVPCRALKLDRISYSPAGWCLELCCFITPLTIVISTINHN